MNKPINQILCTNLVRLRVKNRYSQRQISEILKMPQPSYNKMEAGSTSISGERAYKLAKLYKVSIADFFSENGAVSNGSISSSDAVLLKERLSHFQLMNKILLERNSELQEKLKRRDRKIEVLLRQAYHTY